MSEDNLPPSTDMELFLEDGFHVDPLKLEMSTDKILELLGGIHSVIKTYENRSINIGTETKNS